MGWSSLLHGRCPLVSPLDPQITADLLSNGIDVYPQKEFDEDSEDRLVNEKFRVSAPTRLLFPEAPHFLLEDMGGSSQGSRKTGGVILSHKEVLSGPGGLSEPEGPRAALSGQGVSVLEAQLRATPARGPGSGPAFARASDQCLLPLPQEMIPFAVVGSDHEYQVNGKRILGRKTKWGTIEGNG